MITRKLNFEHEVLAETKRRQLAEDPSDFTAAAIVAIYDAFKVARAEIATLKAAAVVTDFSTDRAKAKKINLFEDRVDGVNINLRAFSLGDYHNCSLETSWHYEGQTFETDILFEVDKAGKLEAMGNAMLRGAGFLRNRADLDEALKKLPGRHDGKKV